MIKTVELLVQVDNRYLDDDDSKGFPVFMMVNADVSIDDECLVYENGKAVSDNRDSIVNLEMRCVAARTIDESELTDAEIALIEHCVYEEARREGEDD